MSPREERERAWARLARDLDRERLRAAARTVPLGEVPEAWRPEFLKGAVKGRLVVDVNA